MPELRQNRFTKEWVIIATERARRPEELKRARTRPTLPHYSETCPFCPGNEHLAPPEILRIGRDGHWAVRVVPNKFPALAREGVPVRTIAGSHRTMVGVGVHDVVVEARDHATTMALLDDGQVAEILRCYCRRYRDLRKDPRVVHITIFKNHGAGAGTSLEHPHSQLIATPVISHQVRERLSAALAHWDEYGECIFCRALGEEIQAGERLVEISDLFVAVVPFASGTPFATHIYPRRHMASFGDITEDEIVDLARVLRRVLARLHAGLGDPDYNFTIRSAPVENAGVKYYHWYLSVIPRLTQVAGFELGSGMFINTVLPEAAASFLRGIDLREKDAVHAGGG